MRPTHGPAHGGRRMPRRRAATRRMCCSTAITTCSRSIPCDLWTHRSVRARAGRRPSGERIVGARRLRRQGPADDLRRGLPRLPRDRRPALRRDGPVRGRGGDGLALAARLPGGQQGRAQGRPRARLRHRHVGRRDAGHHHHAARPGARGGGHQGRRPRPAFGHVRRRGRSIPIHVLARIIADLHDDDGPGDAAGLLRRRRGTARRGGRAMARACPSTRRSSCGGVGLSVPAGEARPQRAGKDLVAPDLRGQRHHGRLYRRGLQDRAAGPGQRQGLVPPRRRAEPRQGPGGLPGLRAGAPAGRLHGRVHPAWREPGAAAAVLVGGADPGAPGAARRMGQGARAGGLGRLDPDRRAPSSRTSRWTR